VNEAAVASVNTAPLVIHGLGLRIPGSAVSDRKYGEKECIVDYLNR